MCQSQLAYYQAKDRRERIAKLRELEEYVTRPRYDDSDLTTHICLITQRAKEAGFDDVAAWMQRKLSEDIRTSRGKRKRGVHVRLGSARGPKAFLDAARVNELAEQHGDSRGQ